MFSFRTFLLIGRFGFNSGKIGTLNAILREVAAYGGLTRDELLALLFAYLLNIDK
ncbi:hypothetical protein [Nostoc sp.]|uniref:hypothetical protein n=1 Tax=Nostoc sp. TaxID=1180 RepID=UPI002FF9AC30